MNKQLLDSLKRHEGWRDKAYQDSEGIWTIGFGRNLQILTISPELGESWLREDMQVAIDSANRFPEFALLNTRARRNVFIEMVFNMGPSRVAGFKNMLSAIKDADWEEVAKQMLDSKWARQVGKRANRLAKLMETGGFA